MMRCGAAGLTGRCSTGRATHEGLSPLGQGLSLTLPQGKTWELAMLARRLRPVVGGSHTLIRVFLALGQGVLNARLFVLIGKQSVEGFMLQMYHVNLLSFPQCGNRAGQQDADTLPILHPHYSLKPQLCQGVRTGDEASLQHSNAQHLLAVRPL